MSKGGSTSLIRRVLSGAWSIVLTLIGLVIMAVESIVGTFMRGRNASASQLVACASADPELGGAGEGEPASVESTTSSPSDASDAGDPTPGGNGARPKPVTTAIVALLAAGAIGAVVAPRQQTDSQLRSAPAVEQQAALSFKNASCSARLVEDKAAHSLSPKVKMSAKVTNVSDDGISPDSLPKIRYGEHESTLSIAGGIDRSRADIEPGKTCTVEFEETLPADGEAPTFSFVEADGVPCEGLDVIADRLTAEVRKAIEALPEEQKRVDEEAKLSDENRPFEFLDVKWSVENREVQFSKSSAIRTVVTLMAKVKNPSTVAHPVEDLPVLAYGGKSAPFDKGKNLAAGGTVDEKIELVFDLKAEPYTFEFKSESGKPSFKGLDGVAEAITKEFAKKFADLSNDIRAEQDRRKAEQEKKRRAEEERRRQEEERKAEEERQRQEEERRRQEEEERQRQAEEAQRQREEAAQTRSVSGGYATDSSAGDGMVAYVTETGTKYHFDPDCKGLNNANEVIGMDLDRAKMGRSPCSICAE